MHSTLQKLKTGWMARGNSCFNMSYPLYAHGNEKTVYNWLVTNCCKYSHLFRIAISQCFNIELFHLKNNWKPKVLVQNLKKLSWKLHIFSVFSKITADFKSQSELRKTHWSFLNVLQKMLISLIHTFSSPATSEHKAHIVVLHLYYEDGYSLHCSCLPFFISKYNH